MLVTAELHRTGYVRVSLWSNGKRSRVWVHVLVAAAFIGPKPDGLEINHVNFIRADNRVGNIEYLTHPDNVRHSARAGRLRGNLSNHASGDAHYSRTQPERLARGDRVRGSKLDADKVLAIRAAYDGSLGSTSRLARQYGVTRRAIVQIVAHNTWSHI